MAVVLGDRVLTPDLCEGTLEEIDQTDGMVRVRHVAWSGEPSCCSTWYDDISALRPLPTGWVRPEPSPENRVNAARLLEAIEQALSGSLRSGR